ncbi:MAG TPA: hypothetical protein VFB06_15340 [Streptosporangiaceae bacterium]|nr:hypothetical protein [Streptosporangiaceae bacterium]
MAHLLDRRRAVARTTLLVHVTAVVVLLMLTAGTEGPAAHGTGTSLTLARFQLFLLAVAGLTQVFMAGRWTQYAVLVRQATMGDPPPADRGGVRALMAMTLAAAWLAEISLVPVAVYQVEHGGRLSPRARAR